MIAIAWFGIQTYLASVVFRVLLTAIHPGFADYDHNSILGLSTLGWACFVAIWFVQLVILAYGMEMVRRYEAFAGPVILVTVASLAGWMYFQVGGNIAWSIREPLSGGEMWRNIFAGGALWLTIYGTLILNFCGSRIDQAILPPTWKYIQPASEATVTRITGPANAS